MCSSDLDHPVLRFKRPIYGVLMFYGIALVCFAVIAVNYFTAKKAGELARSTQAAFWAMCVIGGLALSKTTWDLCHADKRRFLFSKIDAESESHDPTKTR